MNILEADGIELYFDKKTILNNIYFKAEKGKITGILGSNGCGKTSLLKILFGTLKPKYKAIRIDNKFQSKPLYRTGKVQFLPQFNFFPKSMYVKKAFHYYGISFDKFATIFESFKKYQSSSFNQLSGGEKRVIETYLILMSSSKIIFLDEPFSHIAPLYIEKIKQLIIQEKQHKAIVITDHLFKHIVDLSDHLYLIKDGFSKKIENLEDLEFYKYASID